MSVVTMGRPAAAASISGQARCAILNDTKLLLGTNDSATIMDTDFPIDYFPHSAPIRCLACSPPGSKVNWCIIGCADGTLHFWDLDKKGEKASGWTHAQSGKATITAQNKEVRSASEDQYLAYGGYEPFTVKATQMANRVPAPSIHQSMRATDRPGVIPAPWPSPTGFRPVASSRSGRPL